MRSPELSRRAALAAFAAAAAAPRSLWAAPADGAAAGLAAGGLGPAADFSLCNATLLSHLGGVQTGGVRVERGRIVEVGPQVTSGEDLGGAWLCPGFTDAGCTLGMYEIDGEPGTRDDGDKPAVTADARAIDGYNPLSETIPVARAEGVTTALVTPGLGRLVPGQAALVRTAGGTIADVALRPTAGLVLGFGGAGTGGEGGATSRIAVMRMLRQIFDEAPDPVPLGDGEGWRGRGAAPEPPEHEADRVLQAAKERRFKVYAVADRADDIERAVAFFDEVGLDGLILGGAEAWVVAPLLERSGVGVLLGPVNTQPDSFAHLHARYDNAARLAAAGVPFAFRTGANHGVRQLRVMVGLAVAHGLSRELAVTGLTSAAGELLGAPGLGRLEAGARANLVRTTGDPLQPRHRVTGVWIDGRPASLETRQTRLRDTWTRLSPR